MNHRRGVLFASALVAAVLALGSTAFACVVFLGKMTVDGHEGDTTVVGSGLNYGHRYCATGRPTTAAAGHIEDSITATVSPASCPADGVVSHQLPDGTYEVRYNNEKSFTFDGTYWNSVAYTGCYLSTNAKTTSTAGTFDVVNGWGSWTGALGTLAGTPYYSLVPLEAANFCVLDVASDKGLMAPYRLLLI